MQPYESRELGGGSVAVVRSGVMLERSRLADGLGDRVRGQSVGENLQEKPVALKLYRTQQRIYHLAAPQQQNNMFPEVGLHEASIIQLLSPHPHIVKYLGAFRHHIWSTVPQRSVGDRINNMVAVAASSSSSAAAAMESLKKRRKKTSARDGRKKKPRRSTNPGRSIHGDARQSPSDAPDGSSGGSSGSSSSSSNSESRISKEEGVSIADDDNGSQVDKESGSDEEERLYGRDFVVEDPLSITTLAKDEDFTKRCQTLFQECQFKLSDENMDADHRSYSTQKEWLDYYDLLCSFIFLVAGKFVFSRKK